MKNKSSAKVNEFLQKNNIHKKDFAQMIGVTLSYVYNLIDESIPFSTRSTTIERIATVMDILPEDFEEYVIEDDPMPVSKNLEELKTYIKKNKMSIVDFLKQFERKRRPIMVDILRGAKPLPVDFLELKGICRLLNLDDDTFFNLWKKIFIEYLEEGGFNTKENVDLINDMLVGAKKYIHKS